MEIKRAVNTTYTFDTYDGWITVDELKDDSTPFNVYINSIVCLSDLIIIRDNINTVIKMYQPKTTENESKT